MKSETENLPIIGSHLFCTFLGSPNASNWPALTEHEYVVVAHTKIDRLGRTLHNPTAVIPEEWAPQIEPIASRHPTFGSVCIGNESWQYRFMTDGMQWAGKLEEAIQWLDERGLHLMERGEDRIEKAVPAQKAKIAKLLREARTD